VVPIPLRKQPHPPFQDGEPQDGPQEVGDNEETKNKN